MTGEPLTTLNTLDRGPDLLVVCRANRARSPVAAHLLRTYAREHKLRPLPVVASSGLFADANQPLLPGVERVLAARGHEAPDHLSRRFRIEEARAATLVITFEREFVRSIVTQEAALGGRTFTLRELRRLVTSPLWDAAWNGGPELAARLHRLRPRVAAGDDDTPDPAGARGRAARRVLASVVQDTIALAPVLLGDQAVRSVP